MRFDRDGNYVSKHYSANVAASWTAGYLEAVDRFFRHTLSVSVRCPNKKERQEQNYNKELLHITRELVAVPDYFSYKRAVLQEFRDKLAFNLESEINAKEKENTPTRKRMKELRENKMDAYSVDLKEAVIKTLEQMNVPLKFAKHIAENIDGISKVAPDYFSGISLIDRYYKSNVTSNFVSGDRNENGEKILSAKQLGIKVDTITKQLNLLKTPYQELPKPLKVILNRVL